MINIVAKKHKQIDDTVVFGDNVSIECDIIKIGKFSTFGNNIKIKCKTLEIGEHLFMADGVEIGRGGCNSINSNVIIGNHVGIFENTMLNPSDTIEIGDNCGIGAEVMIWTHGAWLDVLQGFPADFGPVSIGHDVWIPARSIILPNVSIGNNVVVGINSVINKDLPSGCFAAGIPCRILKENVYPKKLSPTERKTIITNILDDWKQLIYYKLSKEILVKYDENLHQIKLDNITFDIESRTIKGIPTQISEDLRDYLRRRGIKFFINRRFKSI